jgi:hypothetical protein
MNSKSNSAPVRSGARTRTVKQQGKRARSTAAIPELWAQGAEDSDEPDADMDCQRILLRDGSRSLPLYYDDYN